VTGPDDMPIDAGELSAWLRGMEAALLDERAVDVPCGTCVACCASSQFVHVAPDETDALAHIPHELLFPAPRMPAGHVLLGYDEHGRCPMLRDDGCSIYAHRPRTCRTYDCRVFPATGIEPGGGQEPIARRARRWRFDHPTAADRTEHEALRSVAASLPEEAGTPAQRAVRAIEVYVDASRSGRADAERR
jgi:Fe-S-cluster containining protein